jgi:hypothetical protein
MFAVRWRKRERTQTWSDSQADYLIAILVESEPADGTPREKSVSYLGSIRSDHLGLLWPAKDFWTSVERNLSAVELSPTMREKIISDIRKVVPSPDDEALTKARNEQQGTRR